MWINMFDISQMNKKLMYKKEPIKKRGTMHPESFLKRRVVSPDPRITLMGFSKDAFFSKRKGILKPWLQLKKVNVFADFSKKFQGFRSKLDENNSLFEVHDDKYLSGRPKLTKSKVAAQNLIDGVECAQYECKKETNYKKVKILIMYTYSLIW